MTEAIDRSERRASVDNLITNLVGFEINLTAEERAELDQLTAQVDRDDPLPTRYHKIITHHDRPNEAVVMWSEVDIEGLELRKIEKFQDGRFGFADQNRAIGGCQLSTDPTHRLATINTDPQFEAQSITSDEFEELWNETTTRS